MEDEGLEGGQPNQGCGDVFHRGPGAVEGLQGGELGQGIQRGDLGLAEVELSQGGQAGEGSNAGDGGVVAEEGLQGGVRLHGGEIGDVGVAEVEVTQGGEAGERGEAGGEGVGGIQHLQGREVGERGEIGDGSPGEVQDAELGEVFQAGEVLPGAAIAPRAGEGEGVQMGQARPCGLGCRGREGIGRVSDAGLCGMEAVAVIGPADAEIQAGEVGEIPQFVRPLGEAEVAEIQEAAALFLLPGDAGAGDGESFGG